MNDNICVMSFNNDFFNILRIIQKGKAKNQREMADASGLSLGKINHCLKELKKKGLIKLENFKNNKNKAVYLYLLTPHGLKTKIKLTVNFMKKKSKEYDELKRELEEDKHK